MAAKPNCGVRVGPAPSQEIQPLIVDIRRRIEVFALRQSFSKLGETDLEFLDQCVERLRAAGEQADISALVENDMAFHRFLVEKAGNSDIVSLWLPVVARMMLHYSRHSDWMDSHREHAAIVDAIRACDRRAAIRALEANIQ